MTESQRSPSRRALTACGVNADGITPCIEVEARQRAAVQAEQRGAPVLAERLRETARQVLDVHWQEAELRERRR